MEEITVICRKRNVDANLLADSLGCKINCRTAKIGIRYGSKKLLARPFSFRINHDLAVARSSNKYKALKVMERHDLPIPKTSTCSTCLEYPILGRSFYHKRGRDIIVIKDGNDLRNQQSDYYSQFIPVMSEYRVHVVCGDIVSIAIKLDGEEDTFCRNHDNGWIFKESTWRWKKECPTIDIIAKKAIECMGLDFGAVDILIGKNRKPYILEINTAPGLIERRAGLYALSIKKYITQKGW